MMVFPWLLRPELQLIALGERRVDPGFGNVFFFLLLFWCFALGVWVFFAPFFLLSFVFNRKRDMIVEQVGRGTIAIELSIAYLPCDSIRVLFLLLLVVLCQGGQLCISGFIGQCFFSGSPGLWNWKVSCIRLKAYSVEWGWKGGSQVRWRKEVRVRGMD